jgi:hypothetical protein
MRGHRLAEEYLVSDDFVITVDGAAECESSSRRPGRPARPFFIDEIDIICRARAGTMSTGTRGAGTDPESDPHRPHDHRART